MAHHWGMLQLDLFGTSRFRVWAWLLCACAYMHVLRMHRTFNRNRSPDEVSKFLMHANWPIVFLTLYLHCFCSLSLWTPPSTSKGTSATSSTSIKFVSSLQVCEQVRHVSVPIETCEETRGTARTFVCLDSWAPRPHQGMRCMHLITTGFKVFICQISNTHSVNPHFHITHALCVHQRLTETDLHLYQPYPTTVPAQAGGETEFTCSNSTFIRWPRLHRHISNDAWDMIRWYITTSNQNASNQTCSKALRLFRMEL